MSLRQIAKDSAVYGISNATNGAVSAVGGLLLTRALVPGQYAWIAIVSTLVGLISTFGILGTNSGVQLYFFKPGLTTRQNESAISSGAVVALVSLIITLSLTFVVLGPVTSFRLLSEWLLVLAVGLAFFVTLSHFLQDLRRLKFQPWRFAIVATFGNSVAVCLGLVLVYVADLGVQGYLYGLISGAFIAAHLGLYFARNDFGAPPNREMGLAVLSYSWPLALAGGASWLALSASIWILAALTTNDEVGQYAAAQMPASAVTLVVASVAAAWSPTVMRVWRESSAELDYLLRRFSVLWSGALACLCAVVCPISIAFLTFWLPRDYWAGIQAAPLLILAASLGGTTTFSMLGLTLMEKTRLVAACHWLAALFALGLSLALVPLLGLMGAAASAVAGQFLVTASAAFMSNRVLPIRIPWVPIGAIWAIAAGVAALCALSFESGVGTLHFGAWASSVVAVVMVVLLCWIGLKWQTRDPEWVPGS